MPESVRRWTASSRCHDGPPSSTVTGMASEVIAYVAASLDGYIAGDEGTVDFLEQFGSEEYGYHDYLESVGAVVMGSTTYEQILGWGWPYGSTPGLVLTSRSLEEPDGVAITFSSESTGKAIRAFAATTPDHSTLIDASSVRDRPAIWSKYSCGFPMVIFQQPT